MAETRIYIDGGDVVGPFQQALILARRIGDPESIARLALCRPIPFGYVDEDRLRLVEEALETLGPEPGRARAAALAAYGLMLSFTSERDRGLRSLDEALAMTRAIEDRYIERVVWATTVQARSGPDDLDLRLNVFDAVPDDALSQNDRWLRQIRVAALLEMGDLDRVELEVGEGFTSAPQSHDPVGTRDSQLYGAMRALIEGRLGDAERHADRGLELGYRNDPSNALLNYGAQIAFVRREQGRLGELEEAIRGYIRDFPEITTWQVGLALLLAEAGRLNEAGALFARLSAGRFDQYPRDGTWLATMSLLSDCCVLLNDREHADVLYGLLMPYGGRVPNLLAAVALIPVWYSLGTLAATLGRSGDAGAHFDRALNQCESMHAYPWMVRVAVAHRRLLEAEDVRGNAHRIQELELVASEAARMIH